MTNQSTTAKEALERERVCANCSGKLYQTSDPNNIHWFHNATGDVRCPTRFAKPVSAPSVAPVVDDNDRVLLEALRRVRADQDDFWTFYQADPLMVKAADRIEELLRWHCTEQAMHAAWRKRAEEAEATLAAPASTVAPVERDDIPEHIVMDLVAPAPASPASPAAPTSSDAWATWFKRMGERASSDVVNATATLVIDERLVALSKAGVLPNPAALRDEAKPEYDLDPLEFWCDLAEVLGHPRPTKADVPALVSEVKQRLAATTPPSKEIQAAAEEIDKLLVPLRDYGKTPGISAMAAIIERCLSGGEESVKPD